jgi:hypothetical protein
MQHSQTRQYFFRNEVAAKIHTAIRGNQRSIEIEYANASGLKERLRIQLSIFGLFQTLSITPQNASKIDRNNPKNRQALTL